MKKSRILSGLLLMVATTSAIGGTQGASASGGEQSAESCRWNVSHSGGADALALTDNGKRVSLSRVNTDPAKRVFIGDGVSVEVLYGMSSTGIKRLLEEQVQQQETLAAASLAAAIETGKDVEESETFRSKGQPTDLVPVAYRVSDSTIEEAGVVSDAVRGPNKIAECAKKAVDDDTALVVETPAERVFLPTGKIETEATSLALAATYPTTSSAVRYRTFIPNAEVTAPCGRFKGDNRGFSNSYAAGNRTRASIFFNWPSSTMDTTKGVGATHRINWGGWSAATKTASTAGIKFHTAMMAPTYGRIGINHSVGNPLCSVAGAITYNVIVEAWKGDGARISGTAVKAPNHEAVWYPKTEDTGKNIFRKTGANFFCLSVNCGQWSLWETSND